MLCHVFTYPCPPFVHDIINVQQLSEHYGGKDTSELRGKPPLNLGSQTPVYYGGKDTYKLGGNTLLNYGEKYTSKIINVGFSSGQFGIATTPIQPLHYFKE